MNGREDVDWNNCLISRSASIFASKRVHWPSSSGDRVVLDFGRHARMMTQGIAEPRRASGERKLMTRSRYQNGSLTLRGRSNKVWVARWREDVLGLDGTVQRVRRSLVLGTLASIPKRRQARVLLDAKLCDLNAGRRQPQSAMPFRT